MSPYLCAQVCPAKGRVQTALLVDEHAAQQCAHAVTFQM
ncbi:hypothetical protein XHC_3034 [Xanthomonas hortorum pv. carotae str. M081]|nr:hypothetical protein XHC_3034 [Xanthomonas hortorum pv. carotae str. M081]